LLAINFFFRLISSLLLCLTGFLGSAVNAKPGTMQLADTSVISLSQQLLYAVKMGDSTKLLQTQLSALPVDRIAQELSNDSLKIAFWLNIYNAYTQILIQQNPGAYQRRQRFFGSKKIKLASQNLSLDDIEHGLLRKSKNKWLMGYVNKICPGRLEKKWRVQQLDNRIHFALNCGANSCPPIAFYKPEQIDVQLQKATLFFLKLNSRYDTLKNEIWLPKILSWFRGDFGGKKGIRQLLEAQGILPMGARPRIRFSAYNWSLVQPEFVN
jgi:hypothetical protein